MTAVLCAGALLLTPLVAGAAVLGWIGVRPRHDPLGYAAWAYLAGSLAVALGLFAVVVGRGCVILVLLAVVLFGIDWASRWRAIAGRYRRRRDPDPKPASAPGRLRGPLWERRLFAAVVAICLLIVGDRMLQADARAVVGQDEAHIWAAKAKVLYHGLRSGSGLQEPLASGSIVYHKDYPLLNPLLQAGVFVAAGDVVHVANRVPIQGFFLALVLALAAALRRLARPAVAAALLWLVVTAPVGRMLISQAVADHMVALGLLVTFDAWERYRHGGDRRWWRLAVVALTFTAWSKNEGLMIAVLAAAVAAAVQLASRLPLRGWGLGREAAPSPPGGEGRGEGRWLLLPAAVVLSQLAFNGFYGLGNDLVGSGLGARLGAHFAEYAPAVAAAFADKLLLEPRATQLLAAMMAMLALLFPRRLLRAGLGPSAVVLAAAAAVYFLIYCATPYDLDWHLRTSLERILFHLLPAAALWIAAAAAVALPGWSGAAADAVSSSA